MASRWLATVQFGITRSTEALPFGRSRRLACAAADGCRATAAPAQQGRCSGDRTHLQADAGEVMLNKLLNGLLINVDKAYHVFISKKNRSDGE